MPAEASPVFSSIAISASFKFWKAPSGIESLIKTIEADPRHYSFRTLCREIGNRQFGTWQMGFENPD